MEWYRWWDVKSVRRDDEKKGMTTMEKLECLNAIRLDGEMPADYKMPTIADLKDDSSSVFHMGEGIKLKSCSIKTKHASRRSDAVRDHTHVVTLYDNGFYANGNPKPLKPMLAQVLKIASWQRHKDAVPAYVLKVKVLSSAATASPHVISVNMNAQPREAPAAGGWVGIKQSIAHRQPFMLPKIMSASRNNVVLSHHLFDAYLVPEE